jgi:gamma-glutamyl-gamma-aminobutyrate hydrolase PuuD
MSEKRIFVCTDYDGMYSPFWSDLGPCFGGILRFMKEPESFDLVCFTGGSDIDPALYGHKNLRSGINPSRDKKERAVFEVAAKHNIPQTGICRGAQLISALSGGTMVQDMRMRHGGHRHPTQALDMDQEFQASSAHHQMIVPGPGAEVYAWATQRILPEDCTYDGDLPDSVFDDDGSVRVTEAIYIPQTRCFGVQYHPEWMENGCIAALWYLDKIRELLWGEAVEEIPSVGATA